MSHDAIAGLVAIVIAVSVIGCLVVSLIAWGAFLARLVSRDKTLEAILLFLFFPFGYVFGFIYGWGKVDSLGTRRIMQVWTWSLIGVAGVLLVALCLERFLR